MARLSRVAGDASGWTADERGEVLRLLDRTIDGLATVRATVLVAERQAGTWQGGGDRSFEAWRERTGATTRRAATTQVRQADHLATVPTVVAAVTDGRIGWEHAHAIAQVAATGTPTQQTAVITAQEHLLAQAQHMDADAFTLTVRRWAATVDPDSLEADHQTQRAQRYLHVTTTSRGTYVKGQLDTIAGHRLTLALEAVTPRPAADDDRDPAQRCADALDTMAARILASADTRPGGHVPPQITMILTADTWAAARTHRDQHRHASRTGTAPTTTPAGGEPGAGPDPGPRVTTGYEPATLEDGTPVPASELAAALCDCDVTRLVLDADSAPLDLGRTRRLFTGPQRRAVIARDRHCAWPGCHAHARWCDIHHMTWWDRDTGPTSLDNAVLLCSYHHHETHRRDLTITRAPLGPPAGRPPGSQGTGRDRAPDGIATFGYRITDRTGRAVGEPRRPHFGPGSQGDDAAGASGPGTPLEARAAMDSRSADGGKGPRQPGARQSQRATATRGDPAASASPGTSVREVQEEELDLSWTTDPVTGIRVPAFMLADTAPEASRGRDR